MSRKIRLLVIDGQVDFCAAPGTKIPIFPAGELSFPQGGSLFVPGADKDMDRLAGFVNRNLRTIASIHATLDSHQRVHIAHQRFWVGRDGQPPPILTIVSQEDVKNGVWRASRTQYQTIAADYVDALTVNGRYPLMIWPEHCLVGSIGTAVHPVLYDALMKWEDGFRRVDFVPKGNNPLTEHYSAVKADVPDAADPTTQLNTRLISTLEESDEVVISGEASTHCVANTIRDIADGFSDQGAISKFVYLSDTCSPVPVVSHLEAEFIAEMTQRGMRVSTTKEYMI